jgi:hypothetical protein
MAENFGPDFGLKPLTKRRLWMASVLLFAACAFSYHQAVRRLGEGSDQGGKQRRGLAGARPPPQWLRGGNSASASQRRGLAAVANQAERAQIVQIALAAALGHGDRMIGVP